MHSTKFAFALLAAASTAVLADDTVKLFLPQFSYSSLSGKLIGNDGPLTTYVIDCNKVPKTQYFREIGDCEGSATGWTVLSGPSTFHAEFPHPKFTVTGDCKVSSSTDVSCLATMVSSGFTDLLTAASTLPATELYQTVKITATETGSAKASAKASSTAASATATGTITSKASTASAAAASATETETEASQSSNAAQAMVTGGVRWAAGGAAAMAAIAMV